MNSHEEFIEKLVSESRELKTAFFSQNKAKIASFYDELSRCRANLNQALIFGNGGSAADAQHFAAELMHRVDKNPIGIRAFALHTDTSLVTALANDEGFEEIYSRQIEILAMAGDVAIGITTSGNSQNVIAGLKTARNKECRTIGLLGRDGGKAAEYCDMALIVPHASTPRIQEVHGMLIHIVCQMLEEFE